MIVWLSLSWLFFFTVSRIDSPSEPSSEDSSLDSFRPSESLDEPLNGPFTFDDDDNHQTEISSAARDDYNHPLNSAHGDLETTEGTLVDDSGSDTSRIILGHSSDPLLSSALLDLESEEVNDFLFSELERIISSPQDHQEPSSAAADGFSVSTSWSLLLDIHIYWIRLSMMFGGVYSIIIHRILIW